MMTRTNRFLSFLFLVSIMGQFGCGFLDNDAPTAMFLDIPSVSISANSEQGEPVHKITDVWVNATVGNEIKSLGVYPLPARVPLIIDDLDKVDVTIFPGIRNNGRTSVAFQYKLMSAEGYTFDAVAGETIEIKPVFKYSENAKFDFIEDFEVGNIFTFKGQSSGNGTLVTTTEEASTGQKSGKITVTQNDPLVEVGTFLTFDNADNGKADAYLELDYKNDIPFVIGIYKTQNNLITPTYDVIITEKDEWNRIYIDLSLVLADPSVTSYRAMVFVSLTDSNKAEGNVYLDNVKLVHF